MFTAINFHNLRAKAHEKRPFAPKGKDDLPTSNFQVLLLLVSSSDQNPYDIPL